LGFGWNGAWTGFWKAEWRGKKSSRRRESPDKCALGSQRICDGLLGFGFKIPLTTILLRK
jgi:hypothetical protein